MGTWTKKDQDCLEELERQATELRLRKQDYVAEASERLQSMLTRYDTIASRDAYAIIDALADQWEEIVPLMEEYRKVRK